MIKINIALPIRIQDKIIIFLILFVLNITLAMKYTMKMVFILTNKIVNTSISGPLGHYSNGIMNISLNPTEEGRPMPCHYYAKIMIEFPITNREKKER